MDSSIIFDKNLGALSVANPNLAEKLKNTPQAPDIQIVRSNTGTPVMVRKGVSLHSRRDPESEAEKFAASPLVEDAKNKSDDVAVFGFGSGYHVKALAKKFRCIYVVENSLEVLKEALSHDDWTGLTDRIHIITDQDGFRDIPAGAALITHRPSERIEPGFCSKINLFMENREAPRVRMDSSWNIIVVGPFCGGSLPVAGHAARALRSLGHKVVEVDLSVMDPIYQTLGKLEAPADRKNETFRKLTSFLGDYLSILVETNKPDLVLALAQAPLDPHTLARLRNLGCPSAFWFVEDGRFLKYFREIATDYDLFFHIQGPEMDDELKKLGVKHFFNLPLAADPGVFHPITEDNLLAPYRADLSFMGAGYPNRKTVFQVLLEYDLKIWGTEWDMNTELGRRVQKNGQRIPTNETALIFNAGKINLNLHSSVFTPGLDPVGGFINPRTFEIASCGAFQLVDLRNPLPAFFDPEKEVATFGSVSELKEKVDYYLKRPGLRVEMGKLARKRVLAEHTYQHRMKTMLDFAAEKI